MFVAYIGQLKKLFTVEVPILLGYMIFSRFQVYAFFWLIVAALIIGLVQVLLCAVLSIPTYYAKVFLKRHSTVHIILNASFVLLLVAGVSVLIAFIPNEIDIYGNWSPYFYAIQGGLSWYVRYLKPFYWLTMSFTGWFDGFSSTWIIGPGIGGLYALLAAIGLGAICFALMLFFVNPLYFKLASDSGELLAGKKSRGVHNIVRSPLLSQIYKEISLFFHNPFVFSPLLSTYLFLPIYIALVNKVFGGMNVNIRGEVYIQAVNLILILLILFNSNVVIARIYSEEGRALALSRTLPMNTQWSVLSKLVLPSVLGTLSIIATMVSVAVIREISFGEIVFLAIGILLLYYANLLSSAGLDLSHIRLNSQVRSFSSNAEKRTTFKAFAFPLLLGVLFYFYMRDGNVWVISRPATAGFKILLIGIAALLIESLIYVDRVRYIYKQGESNE